MTHSDEHGAFAFDPELIDPAEELAEAFIHEEFDAQLLAQIDRDEIETLVSRANAIDNSEIDELEMKAAIEVAELVLERLEVFEE